MLTKFGIILENPGINQLSYQFIKGYNEYLSSHDDIDAILYYRNLAPFPLQPNFACMILYEAYRNNSNLIATDLNSAQRILDYFTPSRYFYVWDLEYFYMPNKQYEQLAEIYTHPKLKLICRSEQHAKIMELTWGSKIIGINPNASAEKFRDILNEKVDKNE